MRKFSQFCETGFHIPLNYVYWTTE